MGQAGGRSSKDYALPRGFVAAVYDCRIAPPLRRRYSKRAAARYLETGKGVSPVEKVSVPRFIAF